jgi:prevent-host-death family protein
LAAQNQFGVLLDTSQRAPVVVTRRGRPVAVVQSYKEYQAEHAFLPAHVAKWISEHYPLRGQDASNALGEHFASLGPMASADGLTEADVMRMLDE